MVAITFKGAYLSRENVQDLATLFAIRDQERRGNFGRAYGAVLRLRECDLFDLHFK